ncbi:MAG: glycosyltransferase family 2 protein [Planctomycetota bacterium]|jgi:hypothetical protein
MNIAIVVVTHNRLEYTKKCIPRLLEDTTEQFDLYLWDNASTDETPAYLKNGLNDPRIVEIILSKDNLGQTGAMNYVWSKTKAELVGKLDNDCLVTPSWTRIFAQAHSDVPQLGAVACWHFPKDLFDEDVARDNGKIHAFDGHQIFRHPWVCGSGFLMKRKTYLAQGPWTNGPQIGTTDYFLQMALKGCINGWYFPLITQEHMDDPISEHSLLKDDEAIREMRPVTFSLRFHDINTVEERVRLRQNLIHNLLRDPWRARAYVGWRRKLRRLRGITLNTTNRVCK